jgi:hypothetical protein
MTFIWFLKLLFGSWLKINNNDYHTTSPMLCWPLSIAGMTKTWKSYDYKIIDISILKMGINLKIISIWLACDT